MSGPSVGGKPRRRTGRDSMPSRQTGIAAEVGVLDDGGVGVGHAGPALERLVVLVGDGAHHGADVERLLAVRVGLGGEDLADRAEVAALDVVRERRDVAVGRVGRGHAARAGLAGHDVGVLVVGHQDLEGAGEVGRPVLRLAVRPHHPVVAADAVVVLGGDAAGEVERLLAGEHHRAVRRHHQDALGVHQHRGLGVPVRLGADVDAGDHDVDLAAVLGELHDPAQRRGHPVHVLGAGVHRDPGAGGEREPLDRDLQPLGQVERGDDPQALLLGDRAQRLGGVAAEHDPGDALGVQRRRGGDDGGEDAGLVEAARPVDRHQLALVVEVVLDQRAVRGR